MKWFRMYSDLLTDPKVQVLPGEVFKLWVNLLCIASKNDGKIPLSRLLERPYEPLRAVLGGRYDHLDSYLRQLFDAGLLDQFDGYLTPHNWLKFQPKSDNVAERVRAHRERQCNVTEALHETLHVTTQTRLEENREERTPLRAPPKSGGAKKGSRLSEDWKPEIADWDKAVRLLGPERAVSELSKFRDYWKAACGRTATKLDWHATFRVWIRTAFERMPKNAGKSSGNGATLHLLPNSDSWIKLDSSEWKAWTAYRGGKEFPHDKNGGWVAPSRWPPNHKVGVAG